MKNLVKLEPISNLIKNLLADEIILLLTEDNANVNAAIQKLTDKENFLITNVFIELIQKKQVFVEKLYMETFNKKLDVNVSAIRKNIIEAFGSALISENLTLKQNAKYIIDSIINLMNSSYSIYNYFDVVSSIYSIKNNNDYVKNIFADLQKNIKNLIVDAINNKNIEESIHIENLWKSENNNIKTVLLNIFAEMAANTTHENYQVNLKMFFVNMIKKEKEEYETAKEILKKMLENSNNEDLETLLAGILVEMCSNGCKSQIKDIMSSIDTKKRDNILKKIQNDPSYGKEKIVEIRQILNLSLLGTSSVTDENRVNELETLITSGNIDTAISKIGASDIPENLRTEVLIGFIKQKSVGIIVKLFKEAANQKAKNSAYAVYKTIYNIITNMLARNNDFYSKIENIIYSLMEDNSDLYMKTFWSIITEIDNVNDHSNLNYQEFKNNFICILIKIIENNSVYRENFKYFFNKKISDCNEAFLKILQKKFQVFY